MLIGRFTDGKELNYHVLRFDSSITIEITQNDVNDNLKTNSKWLARIIHI